MAWIHAEFKLNEHVLREYSHNAFSRGFCYVKSHSKLYPVRLNGVSANLITCNGTYLRRAFAAAAEQIRHGDRWHVLYFRWKGRGYGTLNNNGPNPCANLLHIQDLDVKMYIMCEHSLNYVQGFSL